VTAWRSGSPSALDATDTIVPDGLTDGGARPEPDDIGEGCGLPDDGLAGLWLLAGWLAGVWPALKRTGLLCDQPTRMAAAPTPRATAASMMPVITGHRACQGGPGGLEDLGGPAGPGGWTGVPQAVQNWLPGSISRPHLVQCLTISAPAAPGGHGQGAPLTCRRLNGAV